MNNQQHKNGNLAACSVDCCASECRAFTARALRHLSFTTLDLLETLSLSVGGSLCNFHNNDLHSQEGVDSLHF